MLQTPAVMLPRRSHNLDLMQWCPNWSLDVTSPSSYLLRRSIGSSMKPGPSHEARDGARQQLRPQHPLALDLLYLGVYWVLSGHHKATSTAWPHTKPQAAATRE